MDRGKILAIITGAISILLAVGYLVLVQLLDSRGGMLPAPTDLSLSLTHLSQLVIRAIADSTIG